MHFDDIANAPLKLDRDFFHRLPKVDLHVHLDGSLRLETILELAEKDGVDLGVKDSASLRESLKPGFKHASLVDYLKGFDITLKVMQTAADLPADHLAGKTQPLRLPYRRFPPVEEAQQQLAALQAELEQMRAAGRPDGDLRRAFTRVEGAQAQLVMAQTYGEKTYADTEMQTLRIGNLAVVGMPGEPFTRIVLDIKASSPLPHTIAVSYANDYSGYFPDRASVLAGSYEALISPYDESVGERLAQAAVEALKQGWQ